MQLLCLKFLNGFLLDLKWNPYPLSSPKRARGKSLVAQVIPPLSCSPHTNYTWPFQFLKCTNHPPTPRPETLHLWLSLPVMLFFPYSEYQLLHILPAYMSPPSNCSVWNGYLFQQSLAWLPVGFFFETFPSDCLLICSCTCPLSVCCLKSMLHRGHHCIPSIQPVVSAQLTFVD